LYHSARIKAPQNQRIPQPGQTMKRHPNMYPPIASTEPVVKDMPVAGKIGAILPTIKATTDSMNFHIWPV